MNYIIIGLLLSIGWHLVEIVYTAFEEALYVRLHKTKWYQIVIGKRSINECKNNDNIRNKIGFM